MYKACIFDLDGTLTDTLESLTYSVNETLKELNLRTITSEQCRIFVGDGARSLIERALKASGDEEAQLIEEGMKIYKRIFRTNCTFRVKPYDGIVDLLAELKQKGMKLAVVSNKPHEQTLRVVEEIFGNDVFDWVQGQCDEIPKKPAPDGVLFALQKVGVASEDAVYIGDSEVDMVTGKAAGALSVGVNWGFREKSLLEEAGADYTIDHARDLSLILEERDK